VTWVSNAGDAGGIMCRLSPAGETDDKLALVTSICILTLSVQSGRSRGMTRRRRATQVRQERSFKGRQFTAKVILWAVRWHLMFPINYRDLEFMLQNRGVEVDHATSFRWFQAYAAELEKRLRPHLRMSNRSWRVNETYVKVKGSWIYLDRAVDSRGQTIDFLLSARRDAEAAKRSHIVEQDHRNLKRLTRPGCRFGGFWTARRTLSGYEAMAMVRKEQVRNISGNDIGAQATFIAGLFRVAA
jgi:IS6 family transposase